MTERRTVYVGRIAPGWRTSVRDVFDEWMRAPENQPPLSAIWPSQDGDRRRPTRLGDTLEEMLHNLLRGEPTDPWERRKAGLTPTSDKPAL